jgi:hypothetical protein
MNSLLPIAAYCNSRRVEIRDAILKWEKFLNCVCTDPEDEIDFVTCNVRDKSASKFERKKRGKPTILSKR